MVVFGCLWILNGAGQALIEIPSAALVAEHTEAEDRGRAYAAHFALTHVCWLVTYPVTGRLAAAIGPALTFGCSGIACVVIAGIAMAAGRTRNSAQPQHSSEIAM